jgi:hypothetical protein
MTQKKKKKKKRGPQNNRGSSDAMDLSNNSDLFIINGGHPGISNSDLEDEELLMSKVMMDKLESEGNVAGCLGFGAPGINSMNLNNIPQGYHHIIGNGTA